MTILFRCHLLQQIPSENDGAAPTPRSTCVNVLCVRIKEKHPAVCIALSQLDSIFPEKLADDFLTQLAQISGDDAVIKVRSTTRFL